MSCLPGMNRSVGLLKRFTGNFEAGPDREDWSRLHKVLGEGGYLVVSQFWLWPGQSDRLRTRLQLLTIQSQQEVLVEAWMAVKAGTASADYLGDAAAVFCRAVGNGANVLFCSHDAPWWHRFVSRAQIALVFKQAQPE